ncbi:MULTISPECIES: four helix bundle protein [Rhizobium]|uniref:four helix bundle protein n=1 Tax=Rhizobium TaxID=379 RepID=UPI001B34422B|nr:MULTISPECIES: four helix bundle protein [Rhizobium]MBX4910445.1 four helix bundle protein [Rhizobium bangladeshense]MBX5216550.1 four helix bundle protein [Rhizobium sp. NLR9a]MBX5235362.1 four helix bundle protein [Rhizobium sp. NLR4a]MBX5247843.1 four helix bundle protein [Rhizobium sp. NLR3b]MBX5252990.1 four helix bundle protein [Rhizobium sp. NLR4b]
MATAINSYQDLPVWQRSMDLAVECYGLTKGFPKEEVYGLTSQVRRSAASIAANIAEGYGREATGAYVHHLKIAQGSLKELETHLILSARVGIATVSQTQSALSLIAEIGKMLRSLIRRLQDGQNEREN